MSDNQYTDPQGKPGTFTNRVRRTFLELDEKHPKQFWFLFYALIFFIAAILGAGFGLLFPYKAIDVNSARYILSALIQSQAAVISIVISLTLIAVQLTAQIYSPRITEFFKSHINMWCFLASYIISIAFSSFLLILLVGTDLTNSATVRILLYFSLFLAIFLFFALIPYIYITMNLLNADTVIKRLTAAIQIPDSLDPEHDPFQPVFDVIYGAIKRFDFIAMSNGFTQIVNNYEKIVMDNRKHAQLEYINSRFFDDFKRCGVLLIEIREEKFVFEVVHKLSLIINWSVKNELKSSFHWCIITLCEIGVKSAENGMRSPLNETITSIDEIIQDIELEVGPNDLNINSKIYQLIKCQEKLGITAVSNNIEDSAKKAVDSIQSNIERIIEFNTNNNYDIFLDFYLTIGKDALEKHSALVMIEVLDSIEKTYNIAITHKNIKLADDCLRTLKSLGLIAGKLGLKKQISNILNSIFHITVKARDKKLDQLYRTGLEQLAEIRLTYPDIFDKHQWPDYRFDGISDFYVERNFDIEEEVIILDHQIIDDWIKKKR
ncbi:DUF2254 family protein [Methanocalculus chunghsingensis]|nr:DUF2254 family protein [Methanocalculus chunghsingensis]